MIVYLFQSFLPIFKYHMIKHKTYVIKHITLIKDIKIFKTQQHLASHSNIGFGEKYNLSTYDVHDQRCTVLFFKIQFSVNSVFFQEQVIFQLSFLVLFKNMLYFQFSVSFKEYVVFSIGQPFTVAPLKMLTSRSENAYIMTMYWYLINSINNITFILTKCRYQELC